MSLVEENSAKSPVAAGSYLGYHYADINSPEPLPSSRDSARYRNKTPITSRVLNLETIPDMVRVGAVFDYGSTMGPKDTKADKPKTFSLPMDSVRKRQQIVGNLSPPRKPKKIENLPKILDRVVRANCCLEPESPEKKSVMEKAVGDGSDFYNNPAHRAYRIRNKFLKSNFLQDVIEDFAAV